MLSQCELFLKRIIIVDETWVHSFDTEKTQQSSEQCLKVEARLKRPSQKSSKIKTKLTVFFIIVVVLYIMHFLFTGQTVNKKYYLSFLCCKSEFKNGPKMWRENAWVRDNVPNVSQCNYYA